jgi:hypothetical protein
MLRMLFAWLLTRALMRPAALSQSVARALVVLDLRAQVQLKLVLVQLGPGVVLDLRAPVQSGPSMVRLVQVR